jgi:signal transduction histidine kinase
VSAQADDATKDVAGLLKVCNSFVNRTELTSEQDLRLAITVVGGLAGVILLAMAGLSAWQYRRITVPLRKLAASSRKLAGGDFAARCDVSNGDREFAELGADFNRMADELTAFYQQLERMVADKSRELVRAERLASVGYLAAGVAHEINNPLNIMSGHAELSIKQLRRSSDEQTVASAVQALGIIREEAFRCKDITGKLLSLVKGGTHGARETVSLTRAASDVALMVRALKNFQGRRIDVRIDPTELLEVVGNPTEMKQVLLNLTVNALEAVKCGVGEVAIDGRRDGAWVELVVRDNGRGMDAQTLERIFEPFYTEKRGAANPGTGLGLSITHAIVADHGGTLRAASAGQGMGSAFTLRLPAARVDSAAAAVGALAGEEASSSSTNLQGTLS